MALNCQKYFRCCDTRGNYSIWIAFLSFLNKNSNVARNLDVIERNWVHFWIQQPRNIQNQFTDLKQLKTSFFLYTSVIITIKLGTIKPTLLWSRMKNKTVSMFCALVRIRWHAIMSVCYVLWLFTGHICWKMKQNGFCVKKGCRPQP